MSAILGVMEKNVIFLHLAVATGGVEAVQRQLAAAPDPAVLVAAVDEGWEWMNAIHYAAQLSAHKPELLRRLLQANPLAATSCTTIGDTPLHLAAGSLKECAGSVRLLLQAAPATAATRRPSQLQQNCEGQTPFEVLCAPWRHVRWNEDKCCAARLLMAGCGLPPGRLLQSLRYGLPHTLSLFVDVVAGHPLTSNDWQLVPSPCPSLATALPAVLDPRQLRQCC